MKFDKLDKRKEQAIVGAIEQIIDNGKHDPGADLNKIAADVLSDIDGMTPELAARACEAYNKSKSVYTLQKRASEDRAEDFELLEPKEVTKQMYGYHKKVAGADLLFPARTPQDNIPELRRNLEKVAWDASEAPEKPASAGVLERELHRTAIRLERSFQRLEGDVVMRKQASEDAIHRACQVMRKMQTKALKKVAHNVVNRYGDDGVRLIKLVSAYISQDLPLSKTANAAIFPLREPYTSIAIAMDEAREYVKAESVLKKSAALLDKDDALEGATMAGRGLENVAGALTAPLKRFAMLPIYATMAKEQKKADDEVFLAETRNKLKALRATQAFTDIASDGFIKDYPVEDTIQAFNNVVGGMPELLDDKYGSWLKSLVREQLVQGNVHDLGTIRQLQEIGKEIKKGRTADIEEAARTLEAGEGGIIEGMDQDSLKEGLEGVLGLKERERDVKKGGGGASKKELALRERELEERLAENESREDERFVERQIRERERDEDIKGRKGEKREDRQTRREERKEDTKSRKKERKKDRKERRKERKEDQGIRAGERKEDKDTRAAERKEDFDYKDKTYAQQKADREKEIAEGYAYKDKTYAQQKTDKDAELAERRAQQLADREEDRQNRISDLDRALEERTTESKQREEWTKERDELKREQQEADYEKQLKDKRHDAKTTTDQQEKMEEARQQFQKELAYARAATQGRPQEFPAGWAPDDFSYPIPPPPPKPNP